MNTTNAQETTYETYELRDGAITFEVTNATAADLRALTDSQLVLLWDNAVAQWSYRKAAKEGSNGKRFSVADVLTDMATVSVRKGTITPADRERAKQQLAKLEREAEAMFPAQKGDAPEKVQAAFAGREAYVYETFRERVEADATTHRYAMQWPDNQPDEDAMLPLIEAWARTRRLAITRNAREAAKAGGGVL